MNRTRRRLTLALAGAGLAAGCTRSGGDAVRLRFWAMGREGEAAKELLAPFEQANPHIRIEVQQMPWTSAQEKLLTAFAGDVSPDICQLGNTWLPQFAALRALTPLDAPLAASTALDARDYFPGIWDANRVGATLYGIPWYVDTRALYYRKDLLARTGFARPPRDWAEWTRSMAALKARSPSDYAVLLPLNEFEPLLALALQQDAPLLREDGRYGNFRSADFKRTLSFYAGIFRREWAPALSNTQISNVWDEFGNGFFSYYISGPWNIAEFKRRLPADKQGVWMTAPLPGPNGPSASIAGGSSLVVFRSSRHPKEAWQVIEYLSRPEVQGRFYQLTGDLPPRRSAWAEPSLTRDPYAAAFGDQLERAKSPPKVPEWERIATEMRLVTEAVVAGRLSVDEAAAELDARADRILEKRRWMLARGSVQ